MDKNVVLGVDLGRLVDHSALAVVERYQEVRSLPFPTREEYSDRYRVLATHKWPRFTNYKTVVAEIGSMMNNSGLEGAPLAIDATGVGRDVFLMFREAFKRSELGEHWPIGYVITGNGESTTGRDRLYQRVTKVDLVGRLIVVLENKTLEIPAALADAADLQRELDNFRRTVAKKGLQTFAASGTSEHDDLVSAVMLALWHRHNHVEPRYVAATPEVQGPG